MNGCAKVGCVGNIPVISEFRGYVRVMWNVPDVSTRVLLRIHGHVGRGLRQGMIRGNVGLRPTPVAWDFGRSRC